MISYNKQSISNSDINAVSKALRGEIITRGKLVKIFEKKISNLVKSKYCTSFNSASSALTAACFSIGIKKNDIVWTVPNSFVATASCALHFSAKVDFVDIDKDYKNISIFELEKKLTKAKKLGKLPKLLITVHFAGQPPNQKKIHFLSQKYGFKIIEDASHSLGAKRHKEPVGSCKWSDIVVSSFHPVKTITTGEGGVAMTNKKYIFEKLEIFKNNGIVRNPKMFKNKKENFNYEQHYIGHNFNMSDINASLGISQLKRINKFIKARSKINDYYNKNLYTKNILLPKTDKANLSTNHLYIVNLKNKNDRKQIFQKMRKKGFNLNIHYIPIHLHPYYLKKGFKRGNFPNSEWHYDTAISLPIYVDLRFNILRKIVKEFNHILKSLK